MAVFIALSFKAACQIFPAEGAKLNYRIIGFSAPVTAGAATYELQIEPGTILDPEQFAPAISITSSTEKIIGEVPDFGTSYTWRVRCTLADSKLVISPLYHFSTLDLPRIGNTNTGHLNVMLNNSTLAGNYILADGLNAMFDINGKPVWFVPEIGNEVMPGFDIKPTSQNTVTLIYGADAFEIDYNGKVLWRGPDLGSALQPNKRGIVPRTGSPYHHEFYRLSNGNYMALVNLRKDDVEGKASNTAVPKGQHKFFEPTSYNVIYEFDSTGKIVWSWNSAKYLKHSDIGRFYRDVSTLWHESFSNSHENAFYFDEKNKAIYLSYATFNRIIKISYPSGKVVNVFGRIYSASSADSLRKFVKMPDVQTIQKAIFGNDMLSGQHSCHKSCDGNLLLYNNMAGSRNAPQVLALRESSAMYSAGLQKIWSFKCPVDPKNAEFENSGGGNVCEMADSSKFISMNYPHCTFLIVDKSNNIVWSAAPVVDGPNGPVTLSSYRAAIVTRQQLEDLIWRSE